MKRWGLVAALRPLPKPACIRTDTIRYTTSTPHPLRPIEEMADLPGLPSWPFEVVARLTLTASPLWSMPSLREDARRHAAEMGADAIIGCGEAPSGTSAYGQATTPGQSTTYQSPSFGVPIMRSTW